MIGFPENLLSRAESRSALEDDVAITISTFTGVWVDPEFPNARSDPNQKAGLSLGTPLAKVLLLLGKVRKLQLAIGCCCFAGGPSFAVACRSRG